MNWIKKLKIKLWDYIIYSCDYDDTKNVANQVYNLMPIVLFLYPVIVIFDIWFGKK